MRHGMNPGFSPPVKETTSWIVCLGVMSHVSFPAYRTDRKPWSKALALHSGSLRFYLDMNVDPRGLAEDHPGVLSFPQISIHFYSNPSSWARLEASRPEASSLRQSAALHGPHRSPGPSAGNLRMHGILHSADHWSGGVVLRPQLTSVGLTSYPLPRLGLHWPRATKAAFAFSSASRTNSRCPESL